MHWITHIFFLTLLCYQMSIHHCCRCINISWAVYDGSHGEEESRYSPKWKILKCYLDQYKKNKSLIHWHTFIHQFNFLFKEKVIIFEKMLQWNEIRKNDNYCLLLTLFYFWFPEIIKRNYLCICFPLLPHAKASRTRTQNSIWEGSISFSGRNNIFSICLTYATTVYELFRCPMGIVEDMGGMIVCSNLSNFYFYF